MLHVELTAYPEMVDLVNRSLTFLRLSYFHCFTSSTWEYKTLGRRIFQVKRLMWSLLKWLKFFIPQNMGIDTKITLPGIFTEILTKTGFSVMAILMCILCGLASFRFLESTSRRH